MFIPTCYLLFPQQSLFMLPIDCLNLNQRTSDNELQIAQASTEKKQLQEKKLSLYFQIYKEEIIKMRQICSKKCWTQKQDEYLLNLDSQNIDWDYISSLIPQTNPAICKRRYYRLKDQLVKWPPQLDAQIKRLFQQVQLCWSQIRKTINESFCRKLKIPKFSTNKIKQRYTLYLRPGISREQWTVDQDLQLIKLIKLNGKQWTKIIKNNLILQGRTQLQLKNRYFGTLKFLEKKVARKLSVLLKQLSKNSHAK